MLKVGVTGGIGSGKTTVCNVLATLGHPVYHADMEAKHLINTHPKAIRLYKNLFGEDIYSGGQLNSREVAQQVFGSPDLLNKINGVVHPLVEEHFVQWAALQLGKPLVFMEAAILFESGANVYMDKTIGVFASMDERIGRVMERDGLTEQEVRKRMANQMDDSVLKNLCNYHIFNTHDNPIMPQILGVLGELEKIDRTS